MKIRLTFISLLLIALTLAVSSCKKDEKKTDLGNHFTYDGTNYPLSAGILEYYGQGGGNGFNYDVTLFSSGVTWNSNDKLLQGSGNLVIFELYSSSSTEFAAGDYSFDPLAHENQSTFSTGIFGIDFSVDEFTGTMVPVGSGLVNVKKSGTDYELTIT